MLKFFLKRNVTGFAKMKSPKTGIPTIGIAGITIPGATDCIIKINQKSHAYFDKHEHPNIVLNQPNFSPIHQAQELDRWDIVENCVVESISALEKMRADFAIIPANTIHKVIAGIQKRSNIPVLNMLDIVANFCKAKKLKKIGIMGTRWTMADHLYRNPLAKYGIEEITPNKPEQDIIQKCIFNELVPKGTLSDNMLMQLLKVVSELKTKGCDAIALACTELPLVLNDKNCGLVTLDTTGILAEASVEKAHEIKNSFIQSNELSIRHQDNNLK